MTRPYREITADDVGRYLFEAFDKKWLTTSFIGRIMPGDVGKRVYRVADDMVQVENDEQRAARLGRVTVVIHYANGSRDKETRFKTYDEAKEFCRRGISYTGERVRRVEIVEHGGSCIAIWDTSWDELSKARGLK